MTPLPTRKVPALLGAVLALGACIDLDPTESSDDTPNVDETSDAVSVRYGVDYSFARPSPTTLHADGFTFAARYESYDPGKNLTSTEAHSLIAAGLDIVSNWEASATDALGGYSRGVSDAQAANSQFAADGAPSTRPIYFSVDFDATPGDQTAINAYFDGVASVIGRGRTGAYGGYYVIKRLFDAGKITWGWQTYAWSGGQWDSRAHLRQIQNNILGGCCDKDEAIATDFGQWGHPPPPPPAPSGGSSAVIDSAGRYHVFAVNSSGVLVQATYLSTGWLWQSLGGTVKGHPGVTYNPATNRFDVFAPGTNGVMYQKTYANGAWSAWHNIGGSGFTTGASAVIDHAGVYHVFANNTAGILYQGYYTAGAWHWQALGGTIRGNPGVVYTPATNRFDVFAPGTNGVIYQKTYLNGWQAWHAIGGSGFASGASVELGNSGTYNVFAINTSGVLVQAYYTSGAWHWVTLGGTVKGAPGLTYNAATHRYDVFAPGTNGAMYQKTWTGSWSAWHNIGGSALDEVGEPDPTGLDELVPDDVNEDAAPME